MEFSAFDILTGSGDGPKALWAKFDPQWYLKTYPIARGAADPLEFYLNQGAKLGHSPNIFFDEAWYISAHPAVAADLTEGKVLSGFEHYCRFGFRELSPHWLYDPAYYKRSSPDIDETALKEGGFTNLYDHYLKTGARQGRRAHLLFCPELYRVHMTGEGGRSASAGICPFAHYLHAIEEKEVDPSTSIYFDPEWYLLNYADAGNEIAAGKYKCALHHYLTNDNPTAYDPLGDFKENYYLQRYPDVAEHTRHGGFSRRGYMHFLQYGQHEMRDPSPHINLQYYWSRHADIAAGTDLPKKDGPFAHLLTIGVSKGLPTIPASAPADVPEDQARALFLSRAQNMLFLHAKNPIDFSYVGQPKLSVIVVAHDRLAMSLMTLASLRDNYAGAIELIFVDSGSTDETRHIERYVRGAVHIRFETNVGFVHSCNAALHHAGASKVLFLNNDVQLAPGAIAASMHRLESDPKIGAVGAKVIRTNEKLQEAGCVIWRDGNTIGYMRDKSPLCPEANFVRDVDYVSGVFLMVQRALTEELGGFDSQFAPAYFEDSDLCLRIWQAGYRIVYDPAVVVYHYEYGSARYEGAASAMMRRNHKAFFRKHFQTLKNHFAASSEALPSARFSHNSRPRILYVEDSVPLREMGSGFVRSNDLIRTMSEMGYQVTVFPVHGTSASPGLIYGEFPDDVEIMHDLTYHDLQVFLTDRRYYFDCIWICRAHNLDLIKPVLEQAALSPKKTTIVLDTEAIFSIREARLAEIEQRHFNLDRALKREFAHAHFCQELVAVSGQEAAVLRGLGFSHAKVVGTIRVLNLTERSWKDRSGLLFVGSLNGANTPNFDSLCWFVDQVLPIVEEKLGWETRLNIVGPIGAGVSAHHFINHPRVTWHGSVADLEPIYDAHRIAIAPTRFAAGTPYKVYEAASYGVPTVITDMLCQQLDWTPERETLTAGSDDATGFASQIIRLYRSESLWNSIRESAAHRLRTENSASNYVDALSEILPAREQRSRRVGRQNVEPYIVEARREIPARTSP